MKVACPNCSKELIRAEYHKEDEEGDGTIKSVRWYHVYEDYCEDIIYPDYYNTNKDSQYFDTLRKIFNLTI